MERDQRKSFGMSGVPLPSRGNLVMDCARVMRLRIEAGEWGEVLPGERRLAESLQVARDTVRLAIQQLEREGVVTEAEAGSRRKILRGRSVKKTKEARPLKIGVLSHAPLEQLAQPVLLEVDQIRGALAGKGGSLEVFAPAWYEHKNPVKRLEAFVQEERCSAWILLRSSEAVQQWFMDKGVPCLIRGYPHQGIDLPHLDVDWESTARHAASMLWRLGHRRVGILAPAERLRGVAAAVKGAMEFDADGFEAIEMTENGTVEGVTRALTRALQLKHRPTALIATRSRQVATALTWLGSMGLRVPQDLSLVSLAREPFLEHLVPQITGYSIDPEAVAKQVIRRLEALVMGNPHPGGSSWITPELEKGGSVAAVKVG